MCRETEVSAMNITTNKSSKSASNKSASTDDDPVDTTSAATTTRSWDVSTSLLHRSWPLLRLPMCAAGICISYLYYGIFQEQLFTQQDDNKHLGASFVLVTSCLTNVGVALLWNWVQPKREDEKDRPQKSTTQSTNSNNDTTDSINNNNNKLRLNHWLLLATSGAYVGAMVCSNEAVPLVSYPVVVLGKSCKLIPIMIVGQFIERKLYSHVEWLAALFISAGIVLFQFSRMSSINSQDDDDDTKDHQLYGISLLVVSLVLDGVLGSCQNVLKRSQAPYRVPNAIETMLYVNLYALVYLLPWTVWNGQLQEGLQRFDMDAASKLLLVNGAVGCGQIFIFLTIAWYSPVMTTTITTTRKFCTILLSVHTFGHVFTTQQWTAIGLVFGGLYLAILAQQRKPRTDTDEAAIAAAKTKQE